MDAEIRLAEPDDAAAMRAIYAPFVSGTAISFEGDPPTVDEMTERIEATREACPWLVCETDEGNVVGYAKAGRLREETAYRWTVELSVYVGSGAHGHGVGSGLYAALLELLTAQGYRTAYALVTDPNPPSERLHDRFGFERIGTLPTAGYANGAWRDVQWWYRELAATTSDPEPPRSMDALDAATVADGRALGRAYLE